MPTLETVVRVGFLSAEGPGRPLLGAVGPTPAVRLGALSDAVETVTATVEFQLSEELDRRIVDVAGYRPMPEWTWTGIVGRR